ncbi:MAG: DUF4197 domain-containing protein [Porphyromonadaceae bacterium]|nr:MAG: DUF4197 domain-containing protein [Porphyromonadaceae bacterium]
MKLIRNTSTLILIGLLALNTSCDILNQVVSTVDQSSGKLTTDQVAQGLKEALKVGTDVAVKKLNATDGYYLDQIVKINTPPETQELITYAKKVPGLDKLIGDVVLQINRSAEDAAKQAAPIFVNAITSMTIADAWEILNGADTAATGYLREKTFSQLFNLYRPSVRNSLDKPIVAGVSANQSWNQLTKKWNLFAGSVAGKLLSVKQINYTLDEYVTKQALRGLFIKVADQEKLIRTDINARTSELLRRVFGNR